jgi:hypothetical protein
MKAAEFCPASGISDFGQKASSVKSRVANHVRSGGFDELYGGSRSAKCKESLARPSSGGSCHDCWVYPDFHDEFDVIETRCPR